MSCFYRCDYCDLDIADESTMPTCDECGYEFCCEFCLQKHDAKAHSEEEAV